MRHLVGLVSGVIISLAGCSRWPSTFHASETPVVSGTLADQQLAAYPMLGENPYLVLSDFEAPDQFNYFSVSSSGGGRVFAAQLPVVTGGGALGFEAGPDGNTLVFTTPIRRWQEYNLFLVAVFSSNESLSCTIHITDSAHGGLSRPFLLKKGWNKLQMNLTSPGGRLDLSRVERVSFTFTAASGPVYLDDLILLDYHQALLGTAEGTSGTFYAVQDGKRIRLGVPGRFELAFAEGRWVAWYDLSTDRARSRNLVPADAAGVLALCRVGGNKGTEPIAPRDAMVVTHTRLAEAGDRQVDYIVDEYFGEPAGDRPPDLSLVWHIQADGLILLEGTVRDMSGDLGLSVAVEKRGEFDAVVGRVRNPAGTSANRIEYALFRRVGTGAGSDLLVAVRPWKQKDLPVKCRLRPQGGSGIGALLTSPTGTGPVTVQAMLRVWPPDIDNLGSAELYVRKFLEGSLSDLRAPGSSEAWKPTWQIK